MRKLWRVARYEYVRNVFKRSFILALLSVPLVIALNVGVGFLMESMEDSDGPIGTVDHAGLLANPIPAPVADSDEPLAFIPFETEEQAQAALEDGRVQAYAVIAADYFASRRVDLRWYHEEPGSNVFRQLYDTIQINLLADLPPEIARRAVVGDDIVVRSLDGGREFSPSGPTLEVLLPLFISVAFLFLFMMSSGYLMQAIAEEKENRTMEILATSVSPTQLVGGKVLGIVAISLTQLVVWVGIAFLGIVIARWAGLAWFQDVNLNWEIILSMVVIAIPSYVLGAALMTAIGATVTSAQEGQSTSAIFIILYGLPFYLTWLVINDPHSPVCIALSFVPLSALTMVALRNTFAVVPMWQVIASAAAQAIYAVGAIWLAGRALRLGMLRYGQRVRWRQLLKGGSR
ncbi:MAG: ABC transporter permease [Anaerolineae bacterium]|jgi:ABC-2 type transport system permease protein